MTRILHCADLHLEASFAGQGLPPALARQRRADLRQALVRIVGLAREHRVDALTIAGDLYEQDLAGPDTGAFLAQQLATLDPIPVFIAPGDHDPLDGDALYALADWPANVRVFQPGPLTAAEVGPGVCLWGAAHPTDPGQQILAGPRGGHAGTNLLLLHAAWTREDGQGLLRLDGEALQRAGFAAALLGHEHQGRIWQEGAVHCVYPGSPEPLGWADAEGEHLAVLVTVDGSACRFQKLATSRWRYLELRVDISGCASMEEVAGLVAARLRSAPGTVDGCTIGRVVLDGMRRFE
ncbi:MAG: DNA repair exonuclease, partial [Anaerolineae bacterium]|nr:DNA repair exonuclease [Anaerolineae bacterium]